MPKRRRRSFTPQFKAQVVLEVLAGLNSPSEIARQRKLKPELIARSKDIALEGLETLFQGGEQEDRDRIAELATIFAKPFRPRSSSRLSGSRWPAPASMRSR
jgi:transposase-like protein